MAEDLKALIEKIQREGVRVAEDKAKDIEARAEKEAEAIIARARQEADKIIAEAREEADKTTRNGESSLGQAGRDLLLSLREEINVMLHRIVISDIRKAMDPGTLREIISTLIRETNAAKEGEIVLELSEKDAERIEKTFLRSLQEEIKKSITLRPSGEISGGFIISYDGGKSHYDFTDEAIAGYLVARLKPALGKMLNKIASEKDAE